MKNIFCIIVVLFCSFFVNATFDNVLGSPGNELKEAVKSFVGDDEAMQYCIDCPDNVGDFLREYAELVEKTDAMNEIISEAQNVIKESGVEGFACYAFSKFMETSKMNQELDHLTNLQNEQLMAMSFKNSDLTKKTLELERALGSMSRTIYGDNPTVVEGQTKKDFSRYLPKNSGNKQTLLVGIRKHFVDFQAVFAMLTGNQDIASKFPDLVLKFKNRDVPGISQAIDSMDESSLNLLKSYLEAK